MKRYVIRHAHTDGHKNNRLLLDTLGAPLSSDGIEQAKSLGDKLLVSGIRKSEAVAVSNLIRTQQTAQHAGYNNIRCSALLDEVQTGLPTEILNNLLDKKEVPAEAIRRAQMILENPPPELLWITHGLLIVGLHEVLGIHRQHFIPGFCEISELDI